MNLKVLFILTMLVASSFVSTGMGKHSSSEKRRGNVDEQGNSDEQGNKEKQGNSDEQGNKEKQGNSDEQYDMDEEGYMDEQGDVDVLGNMDERGDYYGGDMRLNEDQEPYATNETYAKSGILNTAYRWPNGTIPYVLDPTFTAAEIDTIMAGIKLIKGCTCIDFVTRTNQARYLKIQRGASGTGCWSDVGCQPDRPTVLNLQYNGCIYAGIVAHECLHTIGLYHQQSRSDRDNYVRIHFENTDPTKSYNFDKYTSSQVSTYGTPYDCCSVLHYSKRAFSTNGLDTIEPLNCDPSCTMGQRSYLTRSDCQIVNEMFKGNCPRPVPLLDLIFG